jgi:hypothetical protein
VRSPKSPFEVPTESQTTNEQRRILMEILKGNNDFCSSAILRGELRWCEESIDEAIDEIRFCGTKIYFESPTKFTTKFATKFFIVRPRGRLFLVRAHGPDSVGASTSPGLPYPHASPSPDILKDA